MVTGVGLYFYFESEKAKVQERKRTFRQFDTILRSVPFIIIPASC
jgi:hypothetical protein